MIGGKTSYRGVCSDEYVYLGVTVAAAQGCRVAHGSYLHSPCEQKPIEASGSMEHSVPSALVTARLQCLV